MRRSFQIFRWLATVAVISLFAVVPPSAAHQQWLAPNFFFETGESAWLSFDHTSGDRRFQPSSSPGSYYRWWVVGPDGLRRPVPFIFLGKTRTVGEVELEEAGTYRLEGVEALMPWTQIKVDGENKWYPGTRNDFEGSEIERSRVYFNKAVSYVTLASSNRSVLAASGDPLEIVFEDHPNELRVGDSFRVKVLASGKPLADQEIQVYSEHSSGHDATVTCTTDGKGSCRIELPGPGRFLLRTRSEGDSPASAGTDGYTHSFSVLVEAKEATLSATQTAQND